MSRSTVVYVVMLIICVVGMWFIARAGADLHTTPHLGGHWDILPEDVPATQPVLGPLAGGDIGDAMVVEQSGRYVQVRFAGGLSLDLKAEPPKPPDSDDDIRVQLTGDEGRSLVAEIDATDPDSAYFTLNRTAISGGAFFSARRRENDVAEESPVAGPNSAPHAP